MDFLSKEICLCNGAAPIDHHNRRKLWELAVCLTGELTPQGGVG